MSDLFDNLPERPEAHAGGDEVMRRLMVRGVVVTWAARRAPAIPEHLSGQDLAELADALLKCVG